MSLLHKGLTASSEQLHKHCLWTVPAAAACRKYFSYSMGACGKEFFWQNWKKNWLGTVGPVSVRTRFEPLQSCWTLNWTSGPVQHKGWTLNWTSVQFSKVQVRTSVLDWTSATLDRGRGCNGRGARDASRLEPGVFFILFYFTLIFVLYSHHTTIFIPNNNSRSRDASNASQTMVIFFFF